VLLKEKGVGEMVRGTSIYKSLRIYCVDDLFRFVSSALDPRILFYIDPELYMPALIFL
jgi:hypothetical protein